MSLEYVCLGVFFILLVIGLFMSLGEGVKETTEWQRRAVCTKCGWHKEAVFDDLFHTITGGCCPGCGAEVEERRLAPVWGRPFVIKTMRKVDGEWETKE